MHKVITQESAEQSIHDALEAGDENLLEAFADFAAGEIDDKHVAALLFAILQINSEEWASKLCGEPVRITGLTQTIARLENELERKRAAFIEHEARKAVASEETRLQFIAACE